MTLEQIYASDLGVCRIGVVDPHVFSVRPHSSIDTIGQPDDSFFYKSETNPVTSTGMIKHPNLIQVTGVMHSRYDNSQ